MNHSSSDGLLSASVPASAAAAASSNLIQPAAEGEGIGLSSTPRQFPLLEPKSFQLITQQAPVLNASPARSHRGTLLNMELATLPSSLKQNRSRADMESAMDLLELSKSSGYRRGTYRRSSDNSRGAVQDPSSWFQTLPRDGSAQIPPVRGSMRENRRGDSNRRRDNPKRSKSTGSVVSKFGFIWGTNGNEDCESDKTTSSRHSRLRKMPK